MLQPNGCVLKIGAVVVVEALHISDSFESWVKHVLRMNDKDSDEDHAICLGGELQVCMNQHNHDQQNTKHMFYSVQGVVLGICDKIDRW
jgi:hypothetical protein